MVLYFLNLSIFHIFMDIIMVFLITPYNYFELPTLLLNIYFQVCTRMNNSNKYFRACNFTFTNKKYVSRNKLLSQST